MKGGLARRFLRSRSAAFPVPAKFVVYLAGMFVATSLQDLSLCTLVGLSGVRAPDFRDAQT